MQLQAKLEDSIFSPSFSYYTSNIIASTAIARVIHEEDDVEFSFVLTKEDVSVKIETKATDNKTEASSTSVTDSLRKMFIDEHEELSSCSSSEADELDSVPFSTYCVWSPKADSVSSKLMTKCKKSSSTGSGSKRWKLRYLLRRSNSECKAPVVVLSPKLKRTSGEVTKAKTSVHEQFYVQRKAENEVVKRKTYLPYRKDLVGLFGNVNGMGKMLPF